ncbi:ribosomal protein S18 [Coemansia reversa NRRL 1564]|uniref:Small ribosomal subunit protein bS18m n=1 Tax=Coemansia reversa (strain ATCC 12441 / NRRL 1564) TaxID=763665 RepID=A0A2G5BJG5_COERN|nr:ribosomal protein S18 [Coemansia reversa NRRL 1564]|eukprot:PIA19155.1 ribosomal protein S18 [Coemansia reversa NRRL 1564]
MLSRAIHNLKPRFGTLFMRGFSGGNSSSGNASDIPHSQPKTVQEARMQQINRRVAPLTEENLSKGYYNSLYTNRLLPLTTYKLKDIREPETQSNANKKTETKKVVDPFVLLGMNPLKEYKNTVLLSQFVTEMGRIKARHKTGITAKSQRRIAKAIRRARSFGLIPVTKRFNIGVQPPTINTRPGI